MSYGESVKEFYRRTATFVDKILEGTKPADLPVEQPTWFHLVINRKTAEALGVTIPPHLYVFAEEEINEATQFITPGGAFAAAGPGDGGQIKRPRGRSSPGASYLTLGRSTATGSAAAASGCR